MRARRWPALLAVCACVMLSACQKYTGSVDSALLGPSDALPASIMETPVPAAPVVTEAPPGESPTTMEEPSLYDTVYRHLADFELAFTIEDAEAEAVIEAFQQVLRLHPELFWLGGAYQYTTYSDGAYTVVDFDTLVTEDPEILRQKQAALLAAADELLSSIDPQQNDYEKALAVHDRLVGDTDYDSEGLSFLHTVADDTVRDLEDYETAYGCLVNHRAVCSGYARAYQLLLTTLGIECGRVTGDGKGEAHEWNYVRLDGDEYYVDVTWDDPVMEEADAVTYPCSHIYFGMTTDELAKTHTFDEDQYIPACTTIRYRYYIYEGLYLRDYTYDEAVSRIAAAVDAGGIELLFGSIDACLAAFHDLCEDAAIGGVPGIVAATQCVFFTDPDYPVLQITFGQ